MKKQNGFFKYLLGIDCETSGLQSGNFGRSNEALDGGYYQPVSWGIQVLDSLTLKVVEIKWDGVSKWDAGAERVHGLSKAHLEEHGMDEDEAVFHIGSLIMKYWGAGDGGAQLNCLGHNVVTFDIPFLLAMFARHDIKLRMSHRHYDTNTLALLFSGSFTSDEFFEACGLEKRGEHNALEDIRYEVECARELRKIFKLGLKTL